MTIYAEMAAAGIPIDNHYSDLYVPISEQSSAIVRKYQHSLVGITTFRSQIDGKLWYDIPFAYEPYWEMRR